jgi:tetratricopeptide (TPR) repeat protein
MEHWWGRAAMRSRRGLSLVAVITIVVTPVRREPALREKRARRAGPRSAEGGEPEGAGGGAASGPEEDALVAALKRDAILHPDDAETHYRLGLALRAARRRPESVASFERAAALGPTRDRLLDLGVAYTDVSALRRGGDGVPAPAGGISRRRRRSAQPGEHLPSPRRVRGGDRAVPAGAFVESPLPLRVVPPRAHAEVRRARRGGARRLQRVLELTPANEREQAARVDALYQLGSMELARGKALSAEAYFAEVTKVAPAHRGAHWGRAQALLRLDRKDEARQEIDAHTRLLAERAPTGPSATAP